MLPPREAAKTLAEEQATARPDREPYDGVLSLVKHDHDGDYDEVRDGVCTYVLCDMYSSGRCSNVSLHAYVRRYFIL